jgi:hypothetical protein
MLDTDGINDTVGSNVGHIVGLYEIVGEYVGLNDAINVGLTESVGCNDDDVGLYEIVGEFVGLIDIVG